VDIRHAVIFFYFIGTITRGAENSPDAKDILAVSVSANAGFLADQLIERLNARDYRVVRTSTPEEFLRHNRRLEIPSALTVSVLAGKPMKIRFSRTGEDLGADYDLVRLSRAAYRIYSAGGLDRPHQGQRSGNARGLRETGLSA